jgi:hypothetical protein
MVNGDDSMMQSLALFIHRLQETLFSRRRESSAGRVLAAIIELHQEEKELSGKNIAVKVSEMDEDATTLTAQRVGRLTKKLGFDKDKNAVSRRTVICWDEPRVARLAASYGLSDIFPLSQEKTFESFETYAPNVEPASKVSTKVSEDDVKTFDKSFEREVTSEPKDMKVSKVSVEDRGKVDVTEILGMPVEQALDVWIKAGKPVIHLYPGESCYGLDTLLSHTDILPRHLLAIKDWLSQQMTQV